METKKAQFDAQKENQTSRNDIVTNSLEGKQTTEKFTERQERVKEELRKRKMNLGNLTNLYRLSLRRKSRREVR